ncbi:MAG: efflux RND transporter permease subunit, partial [Chloroflexaceae bacterium]|nr:efflux RND transporter permease subunit [Chloroflexaceae bacterium]
VGFLPATEEYRFDATLTLPPGTPLAETDRVAREIEARLSADPAVEAVLATVGGAGSAERASFLVRLKRDSGSTAANLERLRPALAAYPTLVFSQPSADGSAGTDATSRPIQVRLRGNDVAELTALVPQVQAAMGEVNGLTEIESSSRPGKRELRYELNQARANSYGINNQELANTMQTLVNGSTVGSFKENERSFDIVVRLRPEDRQQVERLSEVRLPLNGELVPLGNLVTLREGTSPTSIRRAARQVEVVVGANVSGRNVAEAQSEVEARLAGLSLPAGVNLSFGGTTEEQEQGFTSLLLAMVLSVVFIYMVLASQFRSFSQPFILMLSMPLSFIGAFLALQISGITLDLFGMIGMLMLLGLATKNSILLIDLTNRLRERGMEKHQALKQAGAARLRPIIMTSMTVIFGAIPTVLGVGDGSELRQGLATAVLGGTITSTLLTLVFVPAAYSLFDGLMSRMQRRTPRHETEDRRPETGATPAIDKVTR